MDSAVLFVSPYPQDAVTLARMLDNVPSLVHAVTVKEAASKLETDSFQTVLTEATLEDGTWLDLLQLSRSLDTLLIVTHPWADVRFWAEAINMGAYDVLAQPFNRMEVRRVLGSAAGRKPLLKSGAAA
jgi:DNA-binding NtrC family response regulator